MLMPNPFKSLYNYLAKVFNEKGDKSYTKWKEREEEMRKLFPEGLPFDEHMIQRSLQGHKSLPPCDAKNPYRFL